MSGYRLIRKWSIAAVIMLFVTGCSSLLVPPRPAPVAVYDFGPDAESVPGNLPVALSSVEILTPTWLRGTGMQYRFEWSQPLRRRVYTESRWAAPPEEMFALVLRRELITERAEQGCRVAVALDEFIQVFDRVDNSRVEVSGEATLIPLGSNAPLTRLRFKVSEPAPTADAEGGVAASRAVARRLSGELTEWLRAFDQAQTQRGKTGAYCR